MMAKPIRALELYYPMIQFLIIKYIQWNLNEVPRDRQNMLPIRWFRYMEILFHKCYYYWGKEIFFYTEGLVVIIEVRLIEVPVYTCNLTQLMSNWNRYEGFS